jgi:hypothetical protein
MAMHPNTPASQPPFAPTEQGDSQPMCQSSIEERFSNMEKQFYLLTTVVREQGRTIEEQSQQMGDMRQRIDEQEEELAYLRTKHGEDTTNTGKLVFNFSKHKKKDIYAWLIEGFHLGIIQSSISAFIRFLAKYTNLGSESSIRSQFYAYW